MFKKLFALGAALLLCLPLAAQAGSRQQALDAALSRHGEAVTFVLVDADSGETLAYNRKRAATPYLPASTFKFVNSLLALDYGVVPSADAVFWHYDGRPVFLAAWKQDMNLGQAFAASNVPAFQQIARAIGPKRMQSGLDRLGYGNRDIGPAVDNFWLEGGALRISANEQAAFLARLARGRLPLPAAVQASVRGIALKESGDGWRLYGKTGWSGRQLPSVGWFAGWVEQGGKAYAFALNMEVAGGRMDELPKREALAREALAALGLAI
ncbi:penicillin-binding transpeptidase domain-containing protein [Crenobacter intestini]|nr:penicillin-binding transpeptidase domain-containing protein [Crenobacter intestini]